ncbi:MAG: galactose-1-phosphate uridylyltransferase [Pseudomonadota bacterium]
MQLSRTVGSKPVHRRDHRKQDGRRLFLYGYSPHELDPVPGEELDRLTGSELRFHPLRQTWSVYAARRNQRTFKPSAAADPLAASTPNHPLTEIPFENFELCIFENRFPAFHSDTMSLINDVAGVEQRDADGCCEVIVYAPEQDGSLATLSQDKRRLILAAWIDRYENLYKEGHAYVLPFENRGEAVGVTLHHPHGQLYALPVIPEPQKAAAQAFGDGYDLSKQLNTWDEDYAIAEAGGIVAFAPPFARFPYEVWLAPRNPVSGPWAFSEEQADGFAHLLGEITRRYDTFFGETTPYMLSLQASPYGRDDRFQFTAQFYPLLRSPGRVKHFASLEQVTGIYSVDIMPEKTASSLRDIK